MYRVDSKNGEHSGLGGVIGVHTLWDKTRKASKIFSIGLKYDFAEDQTY